MCLLLQETLVWDCDLTESRVKASQVECTVVPFLVPRPAAVASQPTIRESS